MAQEYEVREEFKDNSLSQLMDASVLCFQGVGEIQCELLKQYFGIATVRDLANWAQFLWTLEIQELALHGGDLSHTPIREFPPSAQPQFKVRERAQHLTPEQLMMASVQELDGLTPAQDLALYDIFRITNIAQLAHNRIMLEARVIQYLHEQSGGSAAAEPEPVHRAVDSVLARPQASVAGAAQRITEARSAGRDESLVAMAKETREHVGERLAALRERARVRATAPGGEGQAPGAAAGAAAPSRLESVRATHQRAEATVAGQRVAGERAAALVSRRTTVAAAAGGQRGGLDTSRSLGRPGFAGAATGGAGAPAGGAGTAAGAGAMSSRTAAVLAARGATVPAGTETGTATAGRAAAVLAARGGGGSAAAARAPGAGAAVTPGPTARGGAAPTPRPSVTQTAPPAAAAAAQAAPAAAPAAVHPTERRGLPPALWAAAAVVVVIAGVLFFVLRGREQPAPSGTAGPGGSAQPGVATQTGSAPQSGTVSQAGGAPQVAAGAGQQARPAQAGVQGAASAPGAAKTIHTVREGQSLWRISRRYYEVGHEWPIIYKQNQDQIEEPDLIFPKQRFTIPPKP